jgi:hypothetical protein
MTSVAMWSRKSFFLKRIAFLRRLIMSKKFVSTAVLLTVALLACGAAQAANNPLQPSFYTDKATAGASASATAVGETADLSLPTNPLTPTFFAAKAGGANWAATGVNDGVWYLDLRNPLYPGHQHS